MTIHIYLNNYMPYSPSRTLTQLDYNVLKPLIQDPKNTYILHGEPTLYPFLHETLNQLQGKDFILTTDCCEPGVLTRYTKDIPYLALNYDGFMNDTIRNKAGLTNNVISTINIMKERVKTLRLSYTISHANVDWVDADTSILFRLWQDNLKNMKQPFLSVIQQAEVYSLDKFTWIGINADYIKKWNSKGLLTQTNYDYLNTYISLPTEPCTSVLTDSTVAWDGTVRMCMSHRMFETLGDLRQQSFDEIMFSSAEKRQACSNCAYKGQCWLSHHLKNNIV